MPVTAVGSVRSAHPAVALSPALAERVRPVALAGERLLPVDGALSSVLALPGLVRGTTVAVAGPVAATSLAVSLVAQAAAAGSWVAAVGLAPLGLATVQGLGLPLERLVVVAPPEPGRWAAVLAALVEGFDVVLAGPPVRVRPPDARRLVARLRDRRSVLVQVGWPAGRWPEEPELTLAVRRVHWEGIGWGWGHCRARRIEAELTGRRGAGRPRHGWLWLPGPDGRPAVAEPPEAAEALGRESLDACGAAVAGAGGAPAGSGAVPVVSERPRLNLVPGRPARSPRSRRRATGAGRP